MAAIPSEIIIKTQRSRVAIINGDLTERLGFFHKWSEINGADYALIENTEGRLEYIPAYLIRFLHTKINEAAGQERLYRDTGILKGGALGNERSV